MTQNDEALGFISLGSEETHRVIDEVNALLRTQAARIAELEALVAADFDMLDSTWKARAEAAEAEVARLREAVSLTVRADNLREEYHKMPNDKNRIGDKRSRKGHARDAWLRAFRKAARVSRAALQPKEGE